MPCTKSFDPTYEQIWPLAGVWPISHSTWLGLYIACMYPPGGISSQPCYILIDFTMLHQSFFFYFSSSFKNQKGRKAERRPNSAVAFSDPDVLLFSQRSAGIISTAVISAELHTCSVLCCSKPVTFLSYCNLHISQALNSAIKYPYNVVQSNIITRANISRHVHFFVRQILQCL